MRARAALGLLVAAVLGSPGAATAACDAGLALADPDPLHGAAAIGLCDVSSEGSPGVVSASYTTTDPGTALVSLSNGLIGVGLLDAFGTVAPREGERMLALSSGTARAPNHPGFTSPAGFDKGYSGAHPPGFPFETPACAGVIASTPHDAAALRLTLVAPPSAASFSFRHKLHVFDWPDFVCSSFNDVYAVTASPAPSGAQSGGTVVFDSAGNLPGTNSVELLGVCTAGLAGGVSYPCASGPAELAGTGFDEHAATPWLVTTVPVTPGATIDLAFLVWDSGDAVLDTTVLIDDFRWSAASLAAPQTQVVPEPQRLLAALAALLALATARRNRPA